MRCSKYLLSSATNPKPCAKGWTLSSVKSVKVTGYPMLKGVREEFRIKSPGDAEPISTNESRRASGICDRELNNARMAAKKSSALKGRLRVLSISSTKTTKSPLTSPSAISRR